MLKEDDPIGDIRVLWALNQLGGYEATIEYMFLLNGNIMKVDIIVDEFDNDLDHIFLQRMTHEYLL